MRICRLHSRVRAMPSTIVCWAYVAFVRQLSCSPGVLILQMLFCRTSWEHSNCALVVLAVWVRESIFQRAQTLTCQEALQIALSASRANVKRKSLTEVQTPCCTNADPIFAPKQEILVVGKVFPDNCPGGPLPLPSRQDCNHTMVYKIIT